MEVREGMKILEFSGGKDSIACLLLLRDQLHDIIVLWADSGDAFPETHAQMERVKAMCPNFVVVRGNQPDVIEQGGYPVDVMPMRNHAFIQHIAQQQREKMQGFLECCVNSFIVPMHLKAQELGATTIIRGQKMSDPHKSPVRSGDVVDGITFWFPIENWSDEQVLDFIAGSDLLPAHYAEARTSLDCMHCTAYLADNQWKLPYLDKHHPQVGEEVRRRLIWIKSEVDGDMQYLENIIGGSYGAR